MGYVMQSRGIKLDRLRMACRFRAWKSSTHNSYCQLMFILYIPRRNVHIVKIQHVIGIVIENQGRVLLGRHRIGPFADKWGVASAHCGFERPARAAGRIAEFASFGLLGTRRALEPRMVKCGKTPSGLAVYSIQGPDDLATQIKGVTSYVTSCFALDERGPVCPSGLLPWTDVQWMSVEGALSMRLDDYSVEAIRQFASHVRPETSAGA